MTDKAITSVSDRILCSLQEHPALWRRTWREITRLADHACTVCAGVNMEGMWGGNLNQVDMRYGKALRNPSGFFLFIPCSHAHKYSCYRLAEGLSGLGNEERPQLTNTPALKLASGCIPLPHKSVDNDRFISESPSNGLALTCRAR